MESFQREYDAQHTTLQQWYDQRESGVEVAKYNVDAARRPRQLQSFCIWLDGQDWSLPRTDRIYFAKDSTKPTFDAPSGSWTQVRRILNDHFFEEDVYPPRFRVHGFPDAQQLAEIETT